MSKDDLSAIISQVLNELKGSERPKGELGPRPRGVFPTVDQAVDAAYQAHLTLVAMPLEKRKEIIANIRKRCAADVHTLAQMAHEETGLGRVEDKIKKNLLVIHKTPGPEILQPTAYSGDDGLTLIERAPFGVIGSITPCTNPTETIINTIAIFINGSTHHRHRRHRNNHHLGHHIALHRQ